MPVTINGTTGITTPAENTSALTVGSITGILKATSGVVAQAVAGTDYLTSSSGGAITLATAQTATGTAIDFTGIPSWAKRIIVMFSGVSVSGTANYLIQLGAGSVTTTGYITRTTYFQGGTQSGSNPTNGFWVANYAAGNSSTGSAMFTLLTGNTWIGNGYFADSGPNATSLGGSIALSGTLDRVRITTINGTDTFDAGTINISYE